MITFPMIYGMEGYCTAHPTPVTMVFCLNQESRKARHKKRISKMINKDDVSKSNINHSEVCGDCKNFIRTPRRKCKAYPTDYGIPRTIWDGKHDHKTSYPGDNGILFEQMERMPTKPIPKFSFQSIYKWLKKVVGVKS
jgi:hypothetical protein